MGVETRRANKKAYLRDWANHLKFMMSVGPLPIERMTTKNVISHSL